MTFSSSAADIVAARRAIRQSLARSEDRTVAARRLIITGLLVLLALMFVAVLGIALLHEAPDTNSYAQMVDAWLHGRFDITGTCFDSDCATFEGRTYVIFPPAPGIVALPFIAAFGVHFHHFLGLTIVAFALSGFLWWKILASEAAASRDTGRLMLLLTLFATPLFFVTLRGDHVWFYAQSLGFLFCSAALYFAMVRRSALWAGLFIGLAFLSRQMTILYVPFLYVMLLEEGAPWYRIDLAAIRRALKLAAFPLLAVIVYCIYNYLRFHSLSETGYSYIFALDHGPAAGFISHRVQDIGLFSRQYFLFNVVYMFLAGPHVQFVNTYLTEIGGFDANGASLFLVTPALLFAFLARWDRAFWFGLVTCTIILVATLFYHSNGYSQYSAQRYALDWLPILLIFVGRGVKRDYLPPLTLLTFYSMAVTLGMVVIGATVAGVAS